MPLERTAVAATEGKPADRDADGRGSPLPRRRGRPRGAQTRLLSTGAGELGRHHFAFLRALVDGIDLEHAWKRYLAFSGGPIDRRHFASRLRQLVDVIDHAGPQRGKASEAGQVVSALRALPDFVPARAGSGAGKAGRLSAAEAEVAASSPRAPSPTLEDWRSRYW